MNSCICAHAWIQQFLWMISETSESFSEYCTVPVCVIRITKSFKSTVHIHTSFYMYSCALPRANMASYFQHLEVGDQVVVVVSMRSGQRYILRCGRRGSTKLPPCSWYKKTCSLLYCSLAAVSKSHRASHTVYLPRSHMFVHAWSRSICWLSSRSTSRSTGILLVLPVDLPVQYRYYRYSDPSSSDGWRASDRRHT